MTTGQAQSFYFFDFDDNVMYLDTSILVQNTMTGAIERVSTGQYAQIASRLGVPGEWQDYAVFEGSYQHFRDIPDEQLESPDQQHFVADIRHVIETKPPDEWQAPSWEFFEHACAKGRPLSIITARGHHPNVIRAGIRVLKEAGFIAAEPNYLTIYPVSHIPARLELGDENLHYTIPALKKLAIIRSVEVGLGTHGPSLPHQFGMSDDDPKNLQLIIEAMNECKRLHPDKRFFVFHMFADKSVKLEVLPLDPP
ncbi:MAG: hypothetical protein IPM16_15400 [Chloroflexi bacterium]|nr:hypothetical protein [Chloroflexota bacterium]